MIFRLMIQPYSWHTFGGEEMRVEAMALSMWMMEDKL